MFVPGLLVIAASLAQNQPPLPGQGTPITLGAEAAAATRHVWRGIPLSQGPALQPSAWLGAENVLLTGWASFDRQQEDGRGLDTARFQLSFAQQADAFTFLPAVVVYLWPGADSVTWTAEATGDFCWQPGPLGIYWDNAIDVWAARPGFWTEAGGSLVLPLPAGLGLESRVGASFANKPFNEHYAGVERIGIHGATAGLGLTWRHDNGLYGVLSGRLDSILAEELRDTLGTEPLIPSALLSLGWNRCLVWVKG